MFTQVGTHTYIEIHADTYTYKRSLPSEEEMHACIHTNTYPSARKVSHTRRQAAMGRVSKLAKRVTNHLCVYVGGKRAGGGGGVCERSGWGRGVYQSL